MLLGLLLLPGELIHLTPYDLRCRGIDRALLLHCFYCFIYSCECHFAFSPHGFSNHFMMGENNQNISLLRNFNGFFNGVHNCCPFVAQMGRIYSTFFCDCFESSITSSILAKFPRRYFNPVDKPKAPLIMASSTIFTMRLVFLEERFLSPMTFVLILLCPTIKPIFIPTPTLSSVSRNCLTLY